MKGRSEDAKQVPYVRFGQYVCLAFHNNNAAVVLGHHPQQGWCVRVAGGCAPVPKIFFWCHGLIRT